MYESNKKILIEFWKFSKNMMFLKERKIGKESE